MGIQKDYKGSMSLITQTSDSALYGGIRTVTNGSAEILVRWPEAGRWKVLIDPLSEAGAQGLKLCEVIVGPAAGKASIDTVAGCSGASQAPNAQSAAVNVWTPVEFVEVIDAGSHDRFNLRNDIGRPLFPNQWPGLVITLLRGASKTSNLIAQTSRISGKGQRFFKPLLACHVSMKHPAVNRKRRRTCNRPGLAVPARQAGFGVRIRRASSPAPVAELVRNNRWP